MRNKLLNSLRFLETGPTSKTAEISKRDNAEAPPTRDILRRNEPWIREILASIPEY